ncbi:hypothetical protein D9M71_547160 [compost metagenome]
MLVDALEARHHDHAAFLEVGTNLLVVDLQDARLVVRAVGEDAHLVAGVRHRRNPPLHQGHGQQGDGHLLASGHDHIQLSRNRLITDLLGQVDQAIGFATHRRQHHHQVIAGLAEFLDLFGNLLDSLDRADRSAAKFLYDQRHFKAASAHEGHPINIQTTPRPATRRRAEQRLKRPAPRMARSGPARCPARRYQRHHLAPCPDDRHPCRPLRQRLASSNHRL